MELPFLQDDQPSCCILDIPKLQSLMTTQCDGLNIDLKGNMWTTPQ